MTLVACSAITITATATPMISVVINERFMTVRRFAPLQPDSTTAPRGRSEIVRSVDRRSIKNKLRSPCVLFDEAQSELVILEQMRAQVGHGHPLGLRTLDQATDRAL